MSEQWSDREFLDYVDTHSKTERALFHSTHVVRFLKLAGQDEMAELCEQNDVFLAMHYNDIEAILNKARAKLNG